MPVIYRVVKDPSYPHLEPASQKEYEARFADGSWAFNGLRYAGDWSPIEVKRSESGPRPDVWTFHNTLVFEPTVGDPLLYVALRCGDGAYYTMPFEGRNVHPIHVTHVQNCLDLERSEIDDSVTVLSIRKYAFHENRISTTESLFKIHQTHESEILTIHGPDADFDPTCDFKAVYDDHGLTGLCFEELYRW